MAWKKAHPDTAVRFGAALPLHPDATPRKMFGYPACFVNGHFFTGMHEEHTVVIRLPFGIVNHFPELAGAEGFDPMDNGKGMTDWYVIPAAIVASEVRLRSLLASAFEHIHALPPKAPTRRKPTTRRKR